MVEAEVFVGIDVSKDQLDIAVRPGKKFFTISNDDSGIKALVQRLLSLKPQLVVLEATGGYEIPAVYGLFALGDHEPQDHPRVCQVGGEVSQN